jgi:hypothetical protein
MKRMVITAMALLMAVPAYAADTLQCTEEQAFGFRYEKGGWQHTEIESSRTYKVTRSQRPETAWEVELQGSDLRVLCENDFDENGLTRCKGLFTFAFSNRNSFMAIHDVPYTLHLLEQLEKRPYTPYIAAGECVAVK